MVIGDYPTIYYDDMMSEPKDVCLQCGEHRAAIRREGLYCVVMSGGEDSEVDGEYDRHRFRDWTDKELIAAKVAPEDFDKKRRYSVEVLWASVWYESLAGFADFFADENEL